MQRSHRISLGACLHQPRHADEHRDSSLRAQISDPYAEAWTHWTAIGANLTREPLAQDSSSQ